MKLIKLFLIFTILVASFPHALKADDILEVCNKQCENTEEGDPNRVCMEVCMGGGEEANPSMPPDDGSEELTEGESIYKVINTPHSSLRLRKDATTKSKVITSIPDKKIVEFIQEEGKLLKIAGKKGRWTKIKYKTKVGWVFGGFLTDQKGHANEKHEEAMSPQETNETSQSNFPIMKILILLVSLSMIVGIFLYFKKNGQLDKQGTSILPLVFGIVGVVFQLPGALCSGMCAGGVAQTVSGGSNTVSGVNAGMEAATLFLSIGLLAALIGFIASLLGKKKPIFSGLGFLITSVLTVMLTITTFNILSLIAFIFFLIAGLIAFLQKKIDNSVTE